MAEKSKKKKKRKSSILTDYLFYLLVRVVAIFLQLADINTSLRLARWLGGGLYVIYPRGRRRALEHLTNSFPEKSTDWIEHTARRSFEHLVMFAFDVLYTGRLIRSSTWHRYIEFGDMSEVVGMMLRGRGLILVTGHYGNFEVLGCALATFGLETYNIARPIDNRFLNDYVYNVLHHGHTIIYKKGATESMHRILDAGGTLGIVADQNGNRKDVFVDFFGRKASTYKSIALLAMQYNVPIVVGCARRIGNGFRFRLVLTGFIHPADWQDRDDPLYWITAEYTSAIERFVREDPEQYWWIHRRWKTRPVRAGRADSPRS